MSKQVLQGRNGWQTPPFWVRYSVHCFRIGLSLFLLLSMVMSLVGCSSNAATLSWQKATSVVGETLLNQVIQQNTQLEVTEAVKNLLVWNIPGKEGNLTVFNFNTPNLCGSLGCLYVGYWLRNNSSPALVFSSYLNPNLPPSMPLFQVGDSKGKALPCLKVLQADEQRLRQLQFCFNGAYYQVADSQLFSDNL